MSEPTRCQSPKVEEHSSPVPEQRDYCLDLSLVTSPTENSRGKLKDIEKLVERYCDADCYDN